MSRNRISKVHTVLLKLLLFLPLTLLFLLIVLLILIPILPFALYRKCLSFFVQFFKKDFGKILNCSALPHACHQNIIGGFILLEIKIAGKVNLQDFKQEFKKKVIDFPGHVEFRQHITQWGGHLFWRNAPTFKLDEHIKFWPNLYQEISSIRKEILVEKLEPEKPLWNIYFVEKMSKDATILFLRFHHSIADGESISKALSKIFHEGEIEKVIDKKEMHLGVLKTLQKLGNTPQLVLQNYWNLFFNKIQWQKELKPIDFKLKPNEIPIGISSFIKMDRIKEIALKRFGVSPSALILCAISGGIRNFMTKNSWKLPEDANIAIPTPRPGHPEDKLRNYVYINSIKMPMGEESQLKRVQKMEKRLKDLKSSYLQEIGLFIGFLMCQLPVPLFKALVIGVNRPLVFPIVYSGFPRVKQKLSWQGKEVECVGFTSPAYIAGLPLLISSTVSRRGLRFYANGVKSVFPGDESIQQLLNLIMTEFDVLEQDYQHV